MMRKIVLLGIIGMGMITCEFSVTTAKLSESKLCGSYNSQSGCDEDIAVFKDVPDTVFVVSRLNNAPKGTEVRYYWYQLLQDEYILLDSVSYKSQHSSELLHSYISTAALPLGKYRVITKIIADNRDQVVKDFELALPEGLDLKMASVGNSVNEHGKVTNTKANFDADDRMIYYSAFLYNLPANAVIHVAFKDMSDGKLVKELTLNNGDEPEEAILLRANLNRDAIQLDPGFHQIIVTIEDQVFETGYIIL